MKNRIYRTVAWWMCALLLSNCSTLYQSSQMTQAYEAPLPSGLSDFNKEESSQNVLQNSDGWQYLLQNGPGKDALVTMSDGTLKGGQITYVTSDTLFMKTAGKEISIARSEIAVVEIKGSSGALAGGIIGFLVSGVVLTLVASGGEEIPAEGWVLGISLLGIPGGLLGALIGSQVGGDEVIVP